MPRGNDSTFKFKADITDLKASMQEAGRAIRLANSAFKEGTSGMDKWANSADGLSKKTSQLSTVLTAQKRQLSALEHEYSNVAQEQGKDSKAAQELAIRINNQKAAINKTQSELNKYEGELKDCENGTGRFSKELDKSNQSAKNAGEGFTVLKGALASLVASGVRAAINGARRLGEEVVDIGKQSIEAYANYEQLVGGVETLFGAGGKSLEEYAKSVGKTTKEAEKDYNNLMKAQSAVMDNADKAYKTAGMSANTYMETVTSFSASLLQGLGGDTQKAAKVADKAIIDMSDNANKMGTDMTLIQNAYQGFAKQNYTMLDNLKLGYGGTKSEMARLVKDSGVLGKAGEDLTAKNLDQKVSFDQIIEAIHKTQKEMGITGTTSKEASTTIEGSVNSMKAAWENLLVGLADEDQDVDELWNNFVKSAETAAKNLFPRIKTLVERATSFIGEKLREAFPEFMETVDQVRELLVNLFKFIISNGPQIISVLKGIAVAFIAYQVVSTITTVIGKFKILFSTIQAGEGIMKAFNASMALNPWALAIGAIAGLTVAIISYSNSVDDAIQKEYGLTEAQKKSIEKTNEMRKEYVEMDKARDEANSAIDSEYDHLRDLKDEYNSLIGSNGKVKKGYEDRAEFILNELAKSMGVERDEIDKLIDKNGQLGKSIDKIILKKQAEATLEANEDEYKKAIDKKTEALKDYQNKQEEVEKAQKKVNKAEKELKATDHWAAKDIELLDGAVKKYKEYQKQAEKGGIKGSQAKGMLKSFKDIYGEEGAAYIAAKASLDDMNSAYQKAEKTYVGYNSTIKNYEGLSAAIISGDAKKIKAELANIQNDFITAKNGTSNTLKQQVTDFQNNYNTLKEAVKNGAAGVSKADLDEAKQLLDNSKKELLNYFNKSDVVAKAKKSGLTIPKSLAEGIKSGKIDIDTATKNIQSAIDFSKSDAVKKATNLGIKIPKSLSTAIMSGKTSVADASKTVDAAVKFTNMNKNAKGQAKKTVTSIVNQLLAGKISAEEAGDQLKKAGLKGMSGGEKQAKKDGTAQKDNYVKGVKSDPKGVQSAGKTLPKNAKKGADTKDSSTNSESSGKNFLQGFLDGLLNATLLGRIFNAGKGAAKKGKAGLKKGGKEGSPWKTTLQSGEWFMEGFINGINSLTGAVFKTAFNVGSGAVTSLQDAQEEHSPSKITYKSGVNFTKGYIKGIASEEKTLVNTMKNLVKSATTELLKLNNFNFSQVASNASTLFSDKISKQMSYMTDKIAYKNEQKLAQFDKTIANYQKKQNKKEALQDEKKKAQDNIKNIKSQRKTAQSNIKDLESEKQLSKAQKKRLSKLKDQVKDYNKEISKQEDIISKASKKLKNSYSKNYKKAISQQEKAKEQYQEASSKMLSELNSAMSEYQSKAQALIDDTINGITSKYQARYDELINKQNTLIEKLKSAGNLFDISGAGVITVNDIKQQTQNIKDYVKKLETIKAKVSSDLFDQIASYDMEQGNAFMDQLLSLSEADLKAYSDAYDEKMKVAESLAENLYKNDFKNVADEYAQEIKKAMAGLPQQLEALGKEVMKGFVSGLTKDTDYMSKAVQTLVKGMVDTFKSELKISSPSKVTEALGEFTGEGFGDGIKNMIGYVKDVANDLLDASTQSLQDVKTSIGTAKANVGNSSVGVGNTTIINNYDLVQNNNSPKSLSALDTYKARQQQLAMVKAATQSL